MAISSGMSNAAVALPDVLQSYAQSKRLGTLVITRGDLVQHLGLAGGRVVSISGTPPGSLLRSLVWCGHLAVERSVALAERLGTDDAEVARELLEEEGIPMEQVADAISCLVEETFHHALIEQTPEWDLAPEEPPDEWVHIQQSIGVGIGISGLLMECMRRRDEFASIGEFLPEDWDLVIRSQGDAPEGSFSDDQRLVFGLIDDRTPAWEVVDRTWMIPSFANLALAQLLQRGYVKLANERELVLLGDACKEAGDVMRAEGYYARALDLGAHLPRVRFSLGELMAARGANQQAASVFLQAGDELAETRPSEAAIALRNALRLGADPVLCLRRLVLFYEQLDQPADARDALWQLVDRHDQQGEFHEALQAVAELEALGAEERPILERRGVLSERLGETAQALACWDGLLQHIDGDEEPDARTRIQGRILAIDPSRAAIAIDQGRRLQAAGALGDAATMLRSVLTALGDEADPALAIQLHEILAECDPTDTANRQWPSSTALPRPRSNPVTGTV
jgi:tetratricopeptide (TPR) repeat protein